MIYHRYKRRNMLQRLYMVPLYIIPVMIPVMKSHKPVILGVLGLSGLLYLSTFWTLKSKLIQCFRKDERGNYIEFNGELCRISQEHHKSGLSSNNTLNDLEDKHYKQMGDKKIPDNTLEDDLNSSLENKHYKQIRDKQMTDNNLEDDLTDKHYNNSLKDKHYNNSLENKKQPNGCVLYSESESKDIFSNLSIQYEYKRIESFYYDREKYLIINGKILKAEPRLDYTFNEYRNGIFHKNYFLLDENELQLPNPTFISLFKEQCVSPLFCFQIFSSLLMLFDEYVLQSIFSTLMIVGVEAGMVFSRVTTMKVFRSLEQKCSMVIRTRRGCSIDDTTQKDNKEKGNTEGIKDKSGSKCSKDKDEYSMNSRDKSTSMDIKDKSTSMNTEGIMDKSGSMNSMNKSTSKNNDVEYSSTEYPRKEIVESSVLRPGDTVMIDTPMDVPCDMLIIRGSCAANEAMLSGESVPLIKEQVPQTHTILDMKTHKKHILFAGTRVEKIDSPILCVSLRTAFATEQGSLLRQMLRSEDIKYDPEAMRFILILSLIGILNGIFTFKFSSKTGYPLFIDLIVLFTNSIPFELPMEMGVAVQTAVKSLMARKIYCLEPFRVTLAGKINVCCFDKTGTLTDSNLDVKGIELGSPLSSTILSCCNDLMTIDGMVRGDPLDLAILEYLKANGKYETHEILKRSPFSSETRRQAVLASFPEKLKGSSSETGRQATLASFPEKTIFALKGAPETVERLLATVPSDYGRFREFASKGFRVIALAYKEYNTTGKNTIPTSSNTIPTSSNTIANSAGNSTSTLSDSELKTLECGLTFAGFVLFGCSLKHYAKEMCSILADSNHKIIMITGDNVLTAMSVAEQLGICDSDSSASICSTDSNVGIQGSDSEKMTKYSRDTSTLAWGVEGAEIDRILNSPDFFKVRVFARADPKHKERIIKRYKDAGFHTMMVGDGTNDVGALKAADVGVAMLSLPQDGDIRSSNAADSHHSGSHAGSSNCCSHHNSTPAPRKSGNKEKSPFDAEFLKPGDASVAAPFTVKSNSLLSILEIIQQGRTSLVTTIQMYKILALNSITNAFFLSFIDILGIKFSELQMVSIGILSAMAFSAISNGKCLQTLSKQRPQVTIFNTYFLCSIVGQSFIHILTFFMVHRFIGHPTPVKSFEPSLMNTVLFIISSVQTISCFISNYIGRPFREDLFENKMLGLSLLGISAFVINIFMGFYPELNSSLQVVPIGDSSIFVFLLCIFDVLMSYLIERISFKYLLLE